MRSRIREWIEWHLVWGWFGELARRAVIYRPYYFGIPDRVTLGEGSNVNGALLNTNGGTITFGDYSFTGHGVQLLTGTHDISKLGAERFSTMPSTGRDIVIGSGVWLASGCMVLGPCVIGDNAVVAAGAVVTGDVPPGAIVAGVPARVVGTIPDQELA